MNLDIQSEASLRGLPANSVRHGYAGLNFGMILAVVVLRVVSTNTTQLGKVLSRLVDRAAFSDEGKFR